MPLFTQDYNWAEANPLAELDKLHRGHMYPLWTVKHLIQGEQGYSKSICVNETGLSASLKLNIQDRTVQPLPCLPPLVQISN